ncbi:MAG: heme ABC exporter ATP-binding protein CcmA [Pseudomonadota bacterium]
MSLSNLNGRVEGFVDAICGSAACQIVFPVGMGQKPVMSVANQNAWTLEAQGLTKRLGGLQLFTNIDLQVLGGEVLVVRGGNGSGKTTLLRILSGLLEPDAGTVCVRMGLEAIEPSEHASEIHYFGHNNALKASQTTRANLQFWRGYLGGEANVEQIAARMDVAHLLDLPIMALSAGQKRRVGFARLMLAHRPIWLLDEPTAALDAVSSALIETLVEEHLNNGGLAIAATHLPFLQNRARSVDMADFATGTTANQPDNGLDW